MKASQKCIDYIKLNEGLCLKAYKCLSTEQYYTIGYGHYSKDIKKGDTITKEKAEELLKKDIVVFENNVNKYNKIYNFNQNQFDALVSFAFNVGSIDGLTAKGTRAIKEISEKILLYNKSGGKVIKGLTIRRQEEKKWFDTPVKIDVKETKKTTKEVLAVVTEILNNKWGNGENRKKNIEKLGFNYSKIQEIVNLICKY